MKIYIEHNDEEFEEVESVLVSLETFHFIDIETDIETNLTHEDAQNLLDAFVNNINSIRDLKEDNSLRFIDFDVMFENKQYTIQVHSKPNFSK